MARAPNAHVVGPNADSQYVGDEKADYVIYCLFNLESMRVAAAVVYFILSRLLYIAFSANLGLLCMPHPGMGPLV